MRDSCSKQMNILIHGIYKLNDKNETKTQTKEIFENFLISGLEIDPATIGITDIHRLPQHRVAIRGIPVTHPLIVKLQTTFDKALIFQKAKNLKNYNEDRKQNSAAAADIYITEHLPKIFAKTG